MAFQSEKQTQAPEQEQNVRPEEQFVPEQAVFGLPNSALMAMPAPPPPGTPNSIMREMLSDRETSDAEQEADRLSAGITSGTPNSVRRQMGSRLGADFSSIRFHSSEESIRRSDSMGARAFTQGGDVFFGRGGFEPSVAAHELVHTVQQHAVSGNVSLSVPSGTIQRTWLGDKIRAAKQRYHNWRHRNDPPAAAVPDGSGPENRQEHEPEEPKAERPVSPVPEADAAAHEPSGGDNPPAPVSTMGQPLAADPTKNMLNAEDVDDVDDSDAVPMELDEEEEGAAAAAEEEVPGNPGKKEPEPTEESDTEDTKKKEGEEEDDEEEAEGETVDVPETTVKDYKKERSLDGRPVEPFTDGTEVGPSPIETEILSNPEATDPSKSDSSEPGKDESSEEEPENVKGDEVKEPGSVSPPPSDPGGGGENPEVPAEERVPEEPAKNPAEETVSEGPAKDPEEKTEETEVLVPVLVPVDPEKEANSSDGVKPDAVTGGETVPATGGQAERNAVPVSPEVNPEAAATTTTTTTTTNSARLGETDEDDDEAGGVMPWDQQLVDEYTDAREGAGRDVQPVGDNAPVAADPLAVPRKVAKGAGLTRTAVTGANAMINFAVTEASGPAELPKVKPEDVGKAGTSIRAGGHHVPKAWKNGVHPAASVVGDAAGVVAAGASVGTALVDMAKNAQDVEKGNSRVNVVDKGLEAASATTSGVSSGLDAGAKVLNWTGNAAAAASITADAIPVVNIVSGSLSTVAGGWRGIRGQRSVFRIWWQRRKLRKRMESNEKHGRDNTEDQERMQQLSDHARRVAELRRTSGAMQAGSGAIIVTGGALTLASGPAAPGTAVAMAAASTAMGIGRFVYEAKKKYDLIKTVVADELKINWKDEIRFVRSRVYNFKKDKEARAVILKAHGFPEGTRTAAFKKINQVRARYLMEHARKVNRHGHGGSAEDRMADIVVRSLGVHRKWRTGRYAQGAEELLASKLGG